MLSGKCNKCLETVVSTRGQAGAGFQGTFLHSISMRSRSSVEPTVPGVSPGDMRLSSCQAWEQFLTGTPIPQKWREPFGSTATRNRLVVLLPEVLTRGRVAQ